MVPVMSNVTRTFPFQVLLPAGLTELSVDFERIGPAPGLSHGGRRRSRSGSICSCDYRADRSVKELGITPDAP